eukprot:Sspe_Gene.94866::Locus_67185_Transcript_2_2_Confidence_0.667_Length_2143::g.94866::m.94866/K00548/metH, MTR; 5-methyltetrahydrofolate--homocysteine methyltransferase
MMMRSHLQDAWDRWREAERRISAGGILIIDGATGTEVEKVAGEEAMNDKGWSCMCNLTHPDAVKAVHMKYLEAGADIIIANTYATNPNVMEAAELGQYQESSTLAAVRIAREARDEFCDRVRPAFRPLVAGSLSCHPPRIPKGAEFSKGVWPDPLIEEANCARHAQLLMQGGVDVIFVEMVWDRLHGIRAITAACSVGLPVFAAVCVPLPMRGVVTDEVHRQLASGMDIMLGGMGSTTVREAVRDFLCHPVTHQRHPSIVGFNVHHTPLPFVSKTVDAVREAGWTGPVGVYPDHGTFRHPHWIHEPLEESELVNRAVQWVGKGRVQLVGGCCGIGPSYITALAAARGALEAQLKPSSPTPTTPPPPNPASEPSSWETRLLFVSMALILALLVITPLVPLSSGIRPAPPVSHTVESCTADWKNIWFAVMDTNGDNIISRKEFRLFMANHPHLRRRIAKRLAVGNDPIFPYFAKGNTTITPEAFGERWQPRLVGVPVEPCVYPLDRDVAAYQQRVELQHKLSQKRKAMRQPAKKRRTEKGKHRQDHKPGKEGKGHRPPQQRQQKKEERRPKDEQHPKDLPPHPHNTKHQPQGLRGPPTNETSVPTPPRRAHEAPKAAQNPTAAQVEGYADRIAGDTAKEATLLHRERSVGDEEEELAWPDYGLQRAE